jgi:hypothetical protein
MKTKIGANTRASYHLGISTQSEFTRLAPGLLRKGHGSSQWVSLSPNSLDGTLTPEKGYRLAPYVANTA